MDDHPPVEFRPGMRVEILPASDFYLYGVRSGTIVSVLNKKAWVELDWPAHKAATHAGKPRRVSLKNMRPIDPAAEPQKP